MFYFAQSIATELPGDFAFFAPFLALAVSVSPATTLPWWMLPWLAYPRIHGPCTFFGSEHVLAGWQQLAWLILEHYRGWVEKHSQAAWLLHDAA
jgi:hypothetical protein